MIKTYKKDLNMQISKHIQLKELRCRGEGCCSITKYDTKLTKYFERLRGIWGVPITITSAYRCPTHNTEVGGNRNSAHKEGKALDLVCNQVPSFRNRAKVACELIGVPRTGTYKNSPNLIHIGSGVKCHWLDSHYYEPSHSWIPVPYKKPKTLNAKTNAKGIAWAQAWFYVRGYKTKTGKDIKITGKWNNDLAYVIRVFRKQHGWSDEPYLKTPGLNTLEG